MFHRVWIAAFVVVFAFAGACKKKPKPGGDGGSTAAPTAPAAGGAVLSGEGVIAWPVADVRGAPDKGAALVAKLDKGKRVVVLERRDGWSHVRAVDGKAQGWVVSESVEGGVVLGGETPTKQAAAPATRRARVDKKSVNLRDTPNGRKIGKLDRGATLNILRDEGKWLEVEGGAKRGWVAKSVVTLLEPAPAAIADTAATGATGAPPLGAGTVKFKTLNVRDKADGKPVSELKRGMRVTILSEGKTREAWLEVRSDDGKQGWVVARAIEKLAAPKTVASPTSPTAPNPAAEPALSATTPGTSASAGAGTGRVTFKGINLRKSAPRGEVLTTLKMGAVVTVLGKQGAFLHVRAGEHEGFVFAKAIATGPAAAPATATPTTPPKGSRHPDDEGDDDGPPGRADPPKGGDGRVYAVKWTNVNMRRGPSMKAEMIDKLARGTRVRQLDADGNWLKIETVDAQQRRGWVSKNALQLASN